MTLEQHPPDDPVHVELWCMGYTQERREYIIAMAEKIVNISAIELGRQMLESSVDTLPIRTAGWQWSSGEGVT